MKKAKKFKKVEYSDLLKSLYGSRDKEIATLKELLNNTQLRLGKALNEAISKLEIVTTVLRQEQRDKVELRQYYENIIRSRDGLPIIKYTYND